MRILEDWLNRVCIRSWVPGTGVQVDLDPPRFGPIPNPLADMDLSVQIRQWIWTPRSKSASGYGPPPPLQICQRTLIYFVIIQCLSVGTTWYSTTCARNGYTWAARDLRPPRRASGSVLSADRQTLDVFVIVKALFRIPRQSLIVEIRT